MKQTREPDNREELEPSPYLRRSKRVEVRRGAGRWKRILLLGGSLTLVAGGLLAAAACGVHRYLITSPRFTLGETFVVGGAQHVTREQVARVFTADLGRSIFGIPLEKRREELMALPWVESAYVGRGWPNRLRVGVSERKPVAFVRLPPGPTGSSALSLIDREGVLLPLPRRGQFQFPVLAGLSESQTPAEKKRRVALMLAVLEDLDRETPPRSGEISEIDLSDPTDAAVTVSESGAAVLVHLGDAHFLERYKLFLENVEAWRDQYGSVSSVDLRFEKQVIVKP